ncbi:MAG: AAA family ATPase [Cyanobacteriota bacterium]
MAPARTQEALRPLRPRFSIDSVVPIPPGPAADAPGSPVKAPQRVTDDLDRLLEVLPAPVRQALMTPEARDQLLEVVLDLGRVPEARYAGKAVDLGDVPIDREDLAAVLRRLGAFGGDNRAGIERTLHRISAIRNRTGEVVGLTCRVGRVGFGTAVLVRDLLDTGQSLLLMGRPGVGKTTALREIARVLADDLQRRVVVIDTSNEIAGDGDIPHPAIGRARRMQVARPELQHQVMIEAVENHMPEVIVIDEIGTELEAQAARTIAERGVQLVATAHGNELANLLKNPTLSDLVGGIQSVTLGDEEARRRHTQKTVLERAAEPTFPLAVEMHSRHRWLVHRDVSRTVDLLLRGQSVRPQIRVLGDNGQWRLEEAESSAESPRERQARPPRRSLGRPLAPVPVPDPQGRPFAGIEDDEAASTAPPVAEPAEAAAGLTSGAVADPEPVLRLFCCGVSALLVEQVVRQHQWPVRRVSAVPEADAVLSLRQQLGREPHIRRLAQQMGVPILVIKADAAAQIQRAIERLLSRQRRSQGPGVEGTAPSPSPSDPADVLAALEECRLAVERVVLPEGRPVELLPREESVRERQADLVERYGLRSASFGRGAWQRLRVFPR